MVDHDHARLAWQQVADGEDQTRGYRGHVGNVEARWEERRDAVHHCVILVAESSVQPIVEETSGGRGRGIGLGSGGNCGRARAASESKGGDVESEQRPSKEAKGT